MRDSTIERARLGDAAAFAQVTEPHRRELHVHCYRMLGSVTDADDLLQETMLAAWRGLSGFDGRSSVRTWLYTIATRRCLNAIRDTKRRPAPPPVPPFTPTEPTHRGETTWLQPYPDAWLPAESVAARENIALAFVAALQRLPPRQTAAVVLGDVLGFATGEIATMLAESPTTTKGLLQRGRAALRDLDPPGDEPAPPPAAERELAARFADAYAADDIPAVIALLTDDAWLRMPPAEHEYRGHDAIAGFLRAATTWRPHLRFALAPTRVNGQPAFVCSLDGEPAGIVVLTLAGHRLGAVTHFHDMAVHRYVAGA